MASAIEKLEHNVVRIDLDIDQATFQHGLEFAYHKNAKRFSIPGFRKGKAPMSMVIRYYGEGVLYDDAIDHVVNPAYAEAVKEHDLQPVARPQMEIKEIGMDKGLKLSVEVTVKPEVKLGQYKGVEAVKPEAVVTDQQVDDALKQTQERNSRMVPVEDRAILEGDTVNINYEGFKGEEAFEGGKGEDYDLVIGSHTFIPGFEEQLLGKNSGDEFDIQLTFPEDYHSEELKGQAVRFHVLINSVKVKELPVMDDEFAKDVSEFDTMDEYRNSVREDLQKTADTRARNVFQDNAVKAVAANTEIDIPEVMIENELDNLVGQQDQQLRMQGLSLEQYLQYVGQDMAAFREQFKERAAERVRNSLTLEAVADKEELTAEEADVEKQIADLAARYGMKPEALKAELHDDDMAYFSENAKIQKAVEFITAAAVAIPEPVPEEEPAQSEAAPEETTTESNADTAEAKPEA
ncbi:MAG: trigger factor [Oscillospiraceae bacterium]|nr:trigger factor [Oscillospiraceae bacterium]MDD4367895.1 trigger factor [Oscillospiraceae bacterium]